MIIVVVAVLVVKMIMMMMTTTMNMRMPTAVIMVVTTVPVATPTNVQSDTFNSTALEVSWEPVADTREAVRGRVRGYQVCVCV